MDDYSTQSLSESKNEWCSRLVNILTPLVISGFKSIFEEAWKLCEENEEEDKYLMTFQNFLSRVPKWNPSIIEEERKRIIENSGCGYLEDLITCVHIIQLKALTCVRVGQKQKKIDVDVPSLDDFIHKVYISVARKVYTNVYLFEKDIMPLQIQKHNRELELIARECIMNSIRDSIPVEKVLRVYMDETEEQDVTVEENEEVIPVENKEESENIVEKDMADKEKKDEKDETDETDEKKDENVTLVVKTDNVSSEVVEPEKKSSEGLSPFVTKLIEETSNQEKSLINTGENGNTSPKNLSFVDTDKAIDEKGNEEVINAPKNVERLEQISHINNEKRKLEEEDDDDDEEKLNIGTDIQLGDLDIHSIGNPPITPKPDPILNDVEVLV